MENPFDAVRRDLTGVQVKLQAEAIAELKSDPDYDKLANALLFARSAADRLAMRYARSHPSA